MATPRKANPQKAGRKPTGRSGRKLSIYADAALLAALKEINPKPATAATATLRKALLKTKS